MNEHVKADEQTRADIPTSRLIDWFSEGETRVVEVGDVRVVVRFVGRKGRRGRILIEAPAGAAFSTCDAGDNKAGAALDAETCRSK